eukprot:671152-Rhodomonas_salina.7
MSKGTRAVKRRTSDVLFKFSDGIGRPLFVVNAGGGDVRGEYGESTGADEASEAKFRAAIDAAGGASRSTVSNGLVERDDNGSSTCPAPTPGSIGVAPGSCDGSCASGGESSGDSIPRRGVLMLDGGLRGEGMPRGVKVASGVRASGWSRGDGMR